MKNALIALALLSSGTVLADKASDKVAQEHQEEQKRVEQELQERQLEQQRQEQKIYQQQLDRKRQEQRDWDRRHGKG